MKKLKILFLCTGNSCRSQMAEAWAKHFHKDIFDSYSAGIETHGLNPYAIKVMSELKVDMSHAASKHVDTLSEINFDFIITVCSAANETCPTFIGKAKKIHVGFDDPPRLAKFMTSEEEKLDCYRRVRDEIKLFVELLPKTLGV